MIPGIGHAPAFSVPAASARASSRIYNFSAGPGVLPEEVLLQAREDLWDIGGTGMGILEHSHRAKTYDRINAETEELCRKVGDIPSDYKVLFMTGGASSQNHLIPANLLADEGVAAYLTTGYWAERTWEESKTYSSRCYEAWDGRPHKHAFCPSDGEIAYRPWSSGADKPAYVHMCSNNTIYGTQWRHADGSFRYPKLPEGVPLACDMCSDIFSRPFDVRRFGLIYAGAQKNIGAAGCTLVIVREDLLKPARKLPTLMRYDVYAKEESRPNTPPVFAIYLCNLVFKWIISQGGVSAIEGRNIAKAKVVYDALDASAGRGGFYRGHARADSRSLMNITFRTPTAELDELFLKEALAAGMDNLRGHRVTGGMRASLYNAFPMAGAKALADFMAEFERRHG